jgi:hypothetical protein
LGWSVAVAVAVIAAAAAADDDYVLWLFCNSFNF